MLTVIKSHSFTYNWRMLIHYKCRISQARTEKELNFIMGKLDQYETAIKAQLN